VRSSRPKAKGSRIVSLPKPAPNPEEEVSWNLYILQPIPAIPLYEQVIARAHDNVRHVVHTLICIDRGVSLLCVRVRARV
jgi:hypothetical protein